MKSGTLAPGFRCAHPGYQRKEAEHRQACCRNLRTCYGAATGEARPPTCRRPTAALTKATFVGNGSASGQASWEAIICHLTKVANRSLRDWRDRLAVYGLAAVVWVAAGGLSFGGSLEPTYMAAAGPGMSSPEAIIIPPESTGNPPTKFMLAFWKAIRVTPQASKWGAAYSGIITPGERVCDVATNSTGHPFRLKTSAISCEKVSASGSPDTWKIRSPNFGRSARPSTSVILAASSLDILRHANSARNISVFSSASAARALASEACFSAIPTLSSASRCASPLAVMARRMTMYSIINPTPISPFAIRAPIISARSWGTYRTVAISTTIPKRIRSVALADHRSNSSSLWWASFFLWPSAEGPFADLIRRSRRRLAIALLFAAILLAIAILMR